MIKETYSTLLNMMSPVLKLENFFVASGVGIN